MVVDEGEPDSREAVSMRQTYYGDYDYMDRITERKSRRIAIARARQVRRQKLFVIIGIIITLAICSFFSVKAFADTGLSSSASSVKKYKSIMIYCGDTVGSIAEDNCDLSSQSADSLADEIRSINNLSDYEELIPGNYLVIPYYD